MEERMVDAIKEACRALRKRHALEEGAHGPSIRALYSRSSFTPQDSGLQEKIDGLQNELVQCYRAQAQLSEQLVQEVASGKELRAKLVEKESLAKELQEELLATREKLVHMVAELELKCSALDIAVQENLTHQSQERKLEEKLQRIESENKMLIERWMLYKMQEAERINEANEVSASLMEQQKSKQLEELARQQVDGVVRHSEVGAEHYINLKSPRAVKHRLQAHVGECDAIMFEHNSRILVTGGQDRLVKIWDTTSGTVTSTLHGCLGSVLDLALSSDNKFVLGASSDHKLYLWDVQSGRIRHTLTGHTEKVCSVDVSKVSSRRAISASHDRSLKIWDLQTGFGVNTILCHSNCNSLCLTTDGAIVCSGHMDGNLRLWDARTAKVVSAIAAHVQGITSVSCSRGGQTILTSGRDNSHNILDIRTLEVYATLKEPSHRLPSNWSRSCFSADEGFVVAGSIDGLVHVWSRKSNRLECALKEHDNPILACAWSNIGKPLATADKNGLVCLWE